MISTPYDDIASQFAAVRLTIWPKEVEYLALLLEPLKGSGVLLDLGCGTGNPIATYLASRGHAIVGVDGSVAMLDLARARLPDHRWVHNLMEFVEFDETFDGVVCWDSLFHLPRQHWATVIGKVHRWLKPEGRFMVSSGGVVDADNGFVDTMFDHEFYYDSLPPPALLSLLDRIGFDIVIAEMCEAPDGGRSKGKWATVASRRP